MLGNEEPTRNSVTDTAVGAHTYYASQSSPASEQVGVSVYAHYMHLQTAHAIIDYEHFRAAHNNVCKCVQLFFCASIVCIRACQCDSRTCHAIVSGERGRLGDRQTPHSAVSAYK